MAETGAKAIAGIILLLMSDAAAAQVQQETFRDLMGRTAGRSITDSTGSTMFYDDFSRRTGTIKGK